jgi:hypothetical protein
MTIVLGASLPDFSPSYMAMGDLGPLGPAADPFGPNAASGTFYGDAYPGPGYLGAPIVNYAVNYSSIFPGGIIHTSGGVANADVSGLTIGPTGDGAVFFFSFQSVPEPSSLALAAIGFVAPCVYLLRNPRGPARKARQPQQPTEGSAV